LATAVLKRPLGFARRPLPRWRRDYFRDTGAAEGDVVLFVDTFNRYFEPENARAAKTVLEAAGYRVQIPQRVCCGRTFLSVGMVHEAKREARRLLDAVAWSRRACTRCAMRSRPCSRTLRCSRPVRSYSKSFWPSGAGGCAFRR
jgi:Fe-S oxidoreductase